MEGRYDPRIDGSFVTDRQRGSFASSNEAELIQAEQDVQRRIGDLDADFTALSAVSNVFRVAGAARNHFERTVLADRDLSFTAFTVLWVLWVWGEREARHLASEAGITKGTLTGVVSTLEKRGLAERVPHETDRRLVIVRPTLDGVETMRTLFPEFNRVEAEIVADLDRVEQRAFAAMLRRMLRTLDDLAEPEV